MAKSANWPFDVFSAAEIAIGKCLVGLREEVQKRGNDLNEHEIVLLGSIRESETVGEIQRRNATVLQNVSYPLTKLERGGYLTVETDQSDRRKRIIRRTAKGKALVEFCAPILAELIEKHLLFEAAHPIVEKLVETHLLMRASG